MNGLDMLGKLLAILEVELFLAAFFSRTCECVSLRGGVVQDGNAELLVNKDRRLLFGNATRDGLLEAVVNYLLGGSDLRGLLGVERALPAKHPCFKRAAMVKGKDVQRLLIATNGHAHS